MMTAPRMLLKVSQAARPAAPRAAGGALLPRACATTFFRARFWFLVGEAKGDGVLVSTVRVEREIYRPCAKRGIRDARRQASGAPRSVRRRRPGARAISSGAMHKAGAWLCHAPPSVSRTRYFKCLLTSLVISNIETLFLPPNTGRSLSSALIIRRSFWSWQPLRL